MKYYSVTELSIPGVQLLNLIPHSDVRGQLLRVYDERESTILNISFKPKQVNIISTLVKGAVRGLHLQSKLYPEAKIIKCIGGKVFDVVVDLRKESNTFGNHLTVILDSNDPMAIVIPSGCAHGMQALSANVELLYLHDNTYEPANQVGINPMDTTLGIDWPLPISQISERDKALPPLREWK